MLPDDGAFAGSVTGYGNFIFGDDGRRSPLGIGVDVVRQHFDLKSDRAAMILLALLSAPGSRISYRDALGAIGTVVSEVEARDLRHRKLIHIYVCDVRAGLARLDIRDAITADRGRGYQLAVSASRQIVGMLIA